jgi:hypothetical protein
MRENYSPMVIELPKDPSKPQSKAKTLNPVDVVIKVGRITKVTGIGRNVRALRQDTFKDHRGNLLLNTFWYPPEPKASPAPEPLVDLLEAIVPNQAERVYLLDVLSTKWREPWLRLGLIVMVCESHGSGRNTIFNVLEAVFGPENVETVTEDDILGASYQSQ